MKLGMLGMWHSHADGLVRQVCEHPDEFQLVGFYDPDPAVAAGAASNGRRRSPASASSTSPSNCWPNRSMASWSKAASTKTWRSPNWHWKAGGP